MRRTIIALTLFALLAGLLLPGIAGADRPVTVWSQSEITDTDALIARARAGITDLPGDAGLFRLVARDGAGREMEIPMLATTQRLAVVRHPGGAVETRYATTAYADIMFGADGSPVIQWTNYITKSECDPSISYRHTLTQYYSTIVSQGIEYVKVDKYTGKWDRLDYQIIAENASMLAGANGPKLGGGWTYDTEGKTIGTPSSGTTYTLTVPSSWGYVGVSDAGMLYQAGRMDCTLRRIPTGYTWDFGTLIVQGSLDFPWP